MRKRVYIACPISKGDLAHNIRQANAAFLTLFREGFAPFNPVWSVYFGGGVYAAANATPSGLGHGDWLDVDLPWVSVADAVLRLPGASAGADMETALAASRGIPVFPNVELLTHALNPEASRSTPGV
jgi:hypothetical protein